MKGRPKNVRRITFVPPMQGFRPYGDHVGSPNAAPVFMNYEEFEAVKLNDYERHTQEEAARIMGVSRPTFTRIYMSARQKIAQCFVEARRLVIQGGNVELDGNWFQCRSCHAIFSTEHAEASECALCSSKDIERYRLR